MDPKVEHVVVQVNVHRAWRSATYARYSASIFDKADLEPFCNKAQNALVRDTVLEETDDP